MVWIRDSVGWVLYGLSHLSLAHIPVWIGGDTVGRFVPRGSRVTLCAKSKVTRRVIGAGVNLVVVRIEVCMGSSRDRTGLSPLICGGTLPPGGPCAD